jgi:hypothetical protein
MKQGFGWLPTRDYSSAIVATFELLELPYSRLRKRREKGLSTKRRQNWRTENPLPLDEEKFQSICS